MFNSNPNDLLSKILNKQNASSLPGSVVDLKDIIKAIENLDYDFKIPFTLFMEGYKYKEIADIMDLPLGTVKSRIFFTRKKLAKIIN